MSSRREFLQNVLMSGAGLGVSGLIGSAALAFEPLPAGDPWIEAQGILRRIKAPIFPRRDFPINRFGAVVPLSEFPKTDSGADLKWIAISLTRFGRYFPVRM